MREKNWVHAAPNIRHCVCLVNLCLQPQEAKLLFLWLFLFVCPLIVFVVVCLSPFCLFLLFCLSTVCLFLFVCPLFVWFCLFVTCLFVFLWFSPLWTSFPLFPTCGAAILENCAQDKSEIEENIWSVHWSLKLFYAPKLPTCICLYFVPCVFVCAVYLRIIQAG